MACGGLRAAERAPSLELGANVNESLVDLDPVLLDRAEASWVRGFVPASQFITGRRSLATDPGLQRLRAAAASGRHVILTIKWDLVQRRWRVPAPGSPEEAKWFAFATDLARSMHGQLSMLGLVNEVTIDTLPEDLAPPAHGDAPMVVFLQRLAEHLAQAQLKDPSGAALPLYAGGFTRLDQPKMQQSPTVLALLHWIETSPFIAGLDYHLHQTSYDEFRAALTFAHAAVPHKPATVTEFSLIWDFQHHLVDRIGSGEAGRRFLAAYGLAPELTVRDFINQALRTPVPEGEWQAFLASQPWFPSDFLARSAAMMQERGVVVATYGFSQGAPGSRHYPQQREHSAPWMLNQLFVQQVARPEPNGAAPTSYGLFEDFVRWQRRNRASDPRAAVDDPRLQVPPGVKPLFDTWMRDTYVMRADDGWYYLTGTTALPGRATAGDVNDGIRLWRSRDLKSWEARGLVWSLDRDATWQKEPTKAAPGQRSPSGEELGDERRSIWAPEIHYIRSRHAWLLVACMSGDRGSFVLRSTSGLPEGPYVNITGNEHGPIFGEIDPSLFEDDDGTVYFIGHNHFIARMRSDLSGLAEPPRRLLETPYNPEPYGEAVTMVKRDGKYELLQAFWSFRKPDGQYSYFGPQYNTPGRFSYDTVVAESDHIYGPYGPRYTAVVGGGGADFFLDAGGRWWSTMFGNPRGSSAKTAPFLCRPAIFPLHYHDHQFHPDPNG